MRTDDERNNNWTQRNKGDVSDPFDHAAFLAPKPDGRATEF